MLSNYVRRRHRIPRPRGGLWIGIIAGPVLVSCADQPSARKDLLAFLQDGKTNENEVKTRLEPERARGDGRASIWGDGSIWTYRVGETTNGFYLSAQKTGWTAARYSLVLEFDRNGVLRRHALIDVEARP